MWIGEHETSIVVLNELKNRGVQDILICCVEAHDFLFTFFLWESKFDDKFCFIGSTINRFLISC